MQQNYVVINKKLVKNKITNEEQYNMMTKTFQIPDRFAYSIVEVTSDFIARPDLLSQVLYSTPIYSDLLCKINGISNPFELNEGMLLIVPEPNDIDNFYYNEKVDVDAADGLDPSKKVKRKSDKRKPNEAIIGDKRFRIDKNKKIVIY